MIREEVLRSWLRQVPGWAARYERWRAALNNHGVLLEEEDFHQDLRLIILRVARSYDARRGGFHVYMRTRIKWQVLDLLRQYSTPLRHHVRLTNLEDPSNDALVVLGEPFNERDIDLLTALRRLHPRDRLIVLSHYILGETDQETGAGIGLSATAVESRRRRALLRLRRFLDHDP